MMRLTTFALLVPALLAAAGCNKSPSVDLKNATPAEVANAVKQSGAARAMVRPGKWSSTVSVLSIDSPGMPPEVVARMKDSIGKARTVEACLTAEQADHPERMVSQVPDSCRYDHYTMADGKIDGQLRCDDHGMVQEMTLAGSYSPDQYQLTMDNRTTGAGNEHMAMKMHVESHRIGDCDAKQAG